jgi:cytochrome c biogenesis protein CcdA
VIRLIGICISIGLADSLNPTTIAPALYFASGERPRARVFEFTLAVFTVYFVGGVILALGPGGLLLSLVPRPHHRLAYMIEIGAGVAMLAGSTLLWRHRHRLKEREAPEFDSRGRATWVLGATITAIELPTAFPYFAVIATMVGADVEPVNEIILLLIFSVCFVAPLLAILATLTFAGDQAQRILGRGRDFLQAHWPTVLAVVGVIAGAFVILIGVTGLASGGRSGFSRFMHRVHRRLTHPLSR